MKKSAAEAHRMLSNTYGEAAIRERTCREWLQRFKKDDFDVEDQHGIWIEIASLNSPHSLQNNGSQVVCHIVASIFTLDDMLTKYQMIKFIDFYEVWFLPESVARVAAIVGDPRCHTHRH
ncbi:hypothetical protein TNCV_3948001 [Trichonephila clavipes]|nr:hypothetical protein TNCV_3948001 [Trichonephila clavipes]